MSSATIDEQNRYFTTSALKEVMKILDNEIQSVNSSVNELNYVVTTKSALWDSVSSKQDELDFEYRYLKPFEEIEE